MHIIGDMNIETCKRVFEIFTFVYLFYYNYFPSTGASIWFYNRPLRVSEKL
jgi:hypothetical protein